MKRVLPRVLALVMLPPLALVLSAAAAAPPASAYVRDCDRHVNLTAPHALSALTTVLNVRNTSCAHARRVVAAHARDIGRGDPIFEKGGRFALGAFRCRVYVALEEDWRARCTAGSKAFRVDYGA